MRVGGLLRADHTEKVIFGQGSKGMRGASRTVMQGKSVLSSGTASTKILRQNQQGGQSGCSRGREEGVARGEARGLKQVVGLVRPCRSLAFTLHAVAGRGFGQSSDKVLTFLKSHSGYYRRAEAEARRRVSRLLPLIQMTEIVARSRELATEVMRCIWILDIF